jgi:tellurite resistance protein TehA-like permease
MLNCLDAIIQYKNIMIYIQILLICYVNKEVQTSAWEDYSNRPSQIGFDDITSIDTITPVSPTIISDSGDTVAPVNVEIVPKIE